MEEKQYEYKGTVTISTEEYKDLIHGVFSAEKDADSYRSRYWEEQSKTKTLEEKVKALEEKVKAQEKALAHYRDFVNSDSETVQAYKLFLIQKREDEDEI